MIRRILLALGLTFAAVAVATVTDALPASAASGCVKGGQAHWRGTQYITDTGLASCSYLAPYDPAIGQLAEWVRVIVKCGSSSGAGWDGQTHLGNKQYTAGSVGSWPANTSSYTCDPATGGAWIYSIAYEVGTS